MMLGLIEKTAAEVLEYDTGMWEWLNDGDSVLDVVATVEDSTAVVDSIETSPTLVQVRLSGGADGESGRLRLLVTTTQGLTKEVCYRLRVRDC